MKLESLNLSDQGRALALEYINQPDVYRINLDSVAMYLRRGFAEDRAISAGVAYVDDDGAAEWENMAMNYGG